jgi:hypothetical protein
MIACGTKCTLVTSDGQYAFSLDPKEGVCFVLSLSDFRLARSAVFNPLATGPRNLMRSWAGSGADGVSDRRGAGGELPSRLEQAAPRPRSERHIVQGIVEKPLRPPLIERAVASFSGSNRQKILLARGLTRYIAVYLFDEPTVGVDVGAKIEIYDWWRRGSQSFWFLPTCRRFSTSRIGSMTCIDPA